jgi:hypothetical protein
MGGVLPSSRVKKGMVRLSFFASEWKKSHMNLLKSKMAWFLLLIYLFSFVGMTMSLFDFHSGSKGDLAEKMAKYKKEGIPQDDPSFLMMKYGF